MYVYMRLVIVNSFHVVRPAGIGPQEPEVELGPAVRALHEPPELGLMVFPLDQLAVAVAAPLGRDEVCVLVL